MLFLLSVRLQGSIILLLRNQQREENSKFIRKERGKKERKDEKERKRGKEEKKEKEKKEKKGRK